MGIWIAGGIVVTVLLCTWSYYASYQVAKQTEQRGTERDTPIHEVIQAHPFLMNPIILMYVLFGLFTGIMIFTLWATSKSY